MGFFTYLAAFLAAASVVTADPRITSITFSGNGCPNSATFSGSFNSPCVTFSDFTVSLPGSNRTLNCQAHIQATGADQGWQVALSSSTVKGRVALSPGTTLNYYTTVYFSQNAADTDTLRGTLSNTGSSTINQPITLSSTADNDKAWSPCTGSDGYTGILNVNFRSALSGSGNAFFEADSEEWDLVWRQC